MTAADILRRARQLIDRPEKCAIGFTALRLDPERGIHDPITAIVKAAGGNNGDVEAMNALGKVIRGQSIGAWSDNSARTHEQVMSAFDRAIALAEAEGGEG